MVGLQIRYNALCINYLNKFNELINGTDCGNEWCSWLDDKPGDIAIITCTDDQTQYYFSFDVIRYSIDNSISREDIFGWYYRVRSGYPMSISKWIEDNINQ